MTRNNADFHAGLHHSPQPKGSQFTPEYENQPLYHGSPTEITDGVINPGIDGRAWATTPPKDATAYGGYKDGKTPTHIYEVAPIDPKEVVGVYGSRIIKGEFTKHFHSGIGFKIIRKVTNN
jgi:hypothetical protein